MNYEVVVDEKVRPSVALGPASEKFVRWSPSLHLKVSRSIPSCARCACSTHSQSATTKVPNWAPSSSTHHSDNTGNTIAHACNTHCRRASSAASRRRIRTGCRSSMYRDEVQVELGVVGAVG